MSATKTALPPTGDAEKLSTTEVKNTLGNQTLVEHSNPTTTTISEDIATTFNAKSAISSSVSDTTSTTSTTSSDDNANTILTWDALSATSSENIAITDSREGTSAATPSSRGRKRSASEALGPVLPADVIMEGEEGESDQSRVQRTSPSDRHAAATVKSPVKQRRTEISPSIYFEIVEEVSSVRFGCAQCGNVYIRKKKIKSHWRKRHGTDPGDRLYTPPGMHILLQQGHHTQTEHRRCCRKNLLERFTVKERGADSNNSSRAQITHNFLNEHDSDSQQDDEVDGAVSLSYVPSSTSTEPVVPGTSSQTVFHSSDHAQNLINSLITRPPSSTALGLSTHSIDESKSVENTLEAQDLSVQNHPDQAFGERSPSGRFKCKKCVFHTNDIADLIAHRHRKHPPKDRLEASRSPGVERENEVYESRLRQPCRSSCVERERELDEARMRQPCQSPCMKRKNELEEPGLKHPCRSPCVKRDRGLEEPRLKHPLQTLSVKKNSEFDHPQDSYAPPLPAHVEESDDHSLPCQWCDARFANVVRLYLHSRNAHYSQLKEQETAERMCKTSSSADPQPFARGRTAPGVDTSLGHSQSVVPGASTSNAERRPRVWGGSTLHGDSQTEAQGVRTSNDEIRPNVLGVAALSEQSRSKVPDVNTSSGERLSKAHSRKKHSSAPTNPKGQPVGMPPGQAVNAGMSLPHVPTLVAQPGRPQVLQTPQSLAATSAGSPEVGLNPSAERPLSQPAALFSCPLCSFKTTDPDAAVIHVRKHLDEMPPSLLCIALSPKRQQIHEDELKCWFCGEVQNSFLDVYLHMVEQHPASLNERPEQREDLIQDIFHEVKSQKLLHKSRFS